MNSTIVGNDDPQGSHDGAAAIAATRMTKKVRVLTYLRENSHRWVKGHELTAVDVGGTEGLRRLRELRADGYEIAQTRAHEDGSTFVYRIVL